MYRIVTSSIIFIISLGIILSCSGTENTTQKSVSEEVEVQKYPTWYPDQEVVSKEDIMYGYGTAVGKNSDFAVSKAVSWAESELQSSISNRLENIRSEALKESGSESGLDIPEFLIALRKSTNNVGSLMETSNTEVKTVEKYDSYRGFVEIRVSKDKLIEQIGGSLSGYKQAWNTMKESKAFENF
jgi:hypothetical protein